MTFSLRKATADDIPEIQELIAESVRGLSSDDYSPLQIELSIKSVFGVDTDLILDRTYFVAEANGRLVGCGGWGKRKTLYGASHFAHSRESGELDPTRDAAKIRAFFTHRDWARKGIGSAILEACESEAISAGFRNAEMMATLPGVKLYAARGYFSNGRVSVPVGEEVEIECVRMTKALK